MAKRLILPGGSFVDVGERDSDEERDRRARAGEERRRNAIAAAIGDLSGDQAEQLARDMRDSEDPNLLKHFGRGEDNLAAEQLLESQATPAITADLRKKMVAEADPELLNAEAEINVRRFLGQ